MVTVKDIQVGTKFCQPGLGHPHNQMMTVTGIKYNYKNAGKPVKDMFGGTVWSEPFATIEAVGSITGEKKNYVIQTENYDLSGWLTFIENPDERINAIYQIRRKEVIRVANRNLAEIAQKLQDIRNYPAQLNRDEGMKNLIEHVAKAMLEVF